MSIKIFDAIRNSHYTQLSIYLKHEYNFNIKTQEDGYTVLMIALQIPDSEKRFKMFEFLLKQECICANILEEDKTGKNIFFWAVSKQCLPELELLLKYFNTEINWSKQDLSGRTLLHYAVLANNIDLMKLLLKYCSKYKINVDIPSNSPLDNYSKITPYLLACRLNYIQMANLLVNIGDASKHQFDENAHLNANEWLEEGKIEKLETFIENKKHEALDAKRNGKLGKFNELNDISKSINFEIKRNPHYLPIIANILMDNESKLRSSFNASTQNRLRNSLLGEYDTTTASTSGNLWIDMNSVMKSRRESQNLFNDSLTYSNNSFNNLNYLIDNMKNGRIVDSYISSKSEKDLLNATATTNTNNYKNSSLIHDLFKVSTIQHTDNYRQSKVVKPPLRLEPIKAAKDKEQQQQQQQLNKLKSSTTNKSQISSLAIIREEAHSVKTTKDESRKPIKLTQPIVNGIKSSGNDNRSRERVF